MSDSSEWLKVAIDANESSLEDLVRRLSDGSDNSNKALSMALLNQIRVLHQGAKWTFQLAQEHEAKMRTMADEQARVAQPADGESAEPQAGDVAKQILDGMAEQRMSLDAKLDMIAAKIDSKEDLGQLKHDIQQLRDEIHQIAARQGNADNSANTVDDNHENPASRKRRKMEAPESQPKPSQLREDEQRRLAELTEISSPMIMILKRLVPTSGMAFWLPHGIVLALHEIWADHAWSAQNMLSFMDRSRLMEWCCVRQEARIFNSCPRKELAEDGTCSYCDDDDCLQIKPLETDWEGSARRFRVRLVPNRPPVSK